MNDIDFLKGDISDLEHRVSDLEYKERARPCYLYGRSGPVKKCIAVFSNERLCKDFIRSCKLKNPRGKQIFKKSSPLFYWDSLTIEREYVPGHLFFDPRPEDFLDERSERTKGTIITES